MTIREVSLDSRQIGSPLNEQKSSSSLKYSLFQQITRKKKHICVILKE